MRLGRFFEGLTMPRDDWARAKQRDFVRRATAAKNRREASRSYRKGVPRNRGNGPCIPIGTAVHVRKLEPLGKWQPFTTTKTLRFSSVEAFRGQNVIFREKGWEISVPRSSLLGNSASNGGSRRR